MQFPPSLLCAALLAVLGAFPVQATPERSADWSLLAEDCKRDWPLVKEAPAAFSDAFDLVALYATDAVANGTGVLRVALVVRELRGEPVPPETRTLQVLFRVERGVFIQEFNNVATTHDGQHFSRAGSAAEELVEWTEPRPMWEEDRPLKALIFDFDYGEWGMDGQSVLTTPEAVQTSDGDFFWPGFFGSESGDSLKPGRPCDAPPHLGPATPAPSAHPYPLNPLLPLVHASANRTTVRSGEPIRFQGAVTPGGGEVEGVEWDFGDGTQAASLNATHAFFQRGTYRVNFTAREYNNFFGRTAQASLNVTVLNAPPQALASGPSQLRVGTNATFRDHSTDLDGAIASRRWEFPDGGVSSQRNATHAFLRAGTFPVRLTVTDDAGANATKALSVLVVQDLPIARFTAPGSATVGRTVNATDLSTDPDGQLVAWKWTLDGQDVASTRNLTFAMPSAGAHMVCLTVTDDQDATDHVCRLVTGIAQQVAAAASATATGNQTSQSSGQGGSSSQSSSSQGGSQSGQAAGTAGTLAAAPHPSIRILAPTVFAPGKPVQFLAESEGTILAWRWEFGDGGNSTAKAPQHAYAEPGAYQVIATAKTAGGAQLQATAGILIQKVAVAPATAATRAAPLAWFAPLVGLAVALVRRRV
jgi:PKD repeat protein